MMGVVLDMGVLFIEMCVMGVWPYNTWQICCTTRSMNEGGDVECIKDLFHKPIGSFLNFCVWSLEVYNNG